MKYPERVSARMILFKDSEGIILVRQQTRVHFGISRSPIGTVIMTNPGSFEFKQIEGWEEYKTGLSNNDVFEGNGTADLTMQNLIEVIREGYMRAGLGVPNGILNIYNISNVVQKKGEKAESSHKRVLKIISNMESKHHLQVLIDPVTNNKERFLSVCRLSPFIMMGFVDNVFPQQVSDLMDWSQSVKEKIVVAEDRKNRYSHPRRWRTEKYLKEIAIDNMVRVLRS